MFSAAVLSNLVSSKFGIIGSTYWGIVDTWILWAEWKIGHAGIRYIDDNISLQLSRYFKLSMHNRIFLVSVLPPSWWWLLDCSSEVCWEFCSVSLGPLTCLSRHRMQSSAALANTRVLSVERKTRKTSSNGADSTVSAVPTDATLNAPNNGRQPERISVRFVSTNSHMQLTICELVDHDLDILLMILLSFFLWGEWDNYWWVGKGEPLI